MDFVIPVAVRLRYNNIGTTAQDIPCNLGKNNAFLRVESVLYIRTNTDNGKHDHTSPCRLLHGLAFVPDKRSINHQVQCSTRNRLSVSVLSVVLLVLDAVAAGDVHEAFACLASVSALPRVCSLASLLDVYSSLALPQPMAEAQHSTLRW